jgi:NitT/TauT family transport system ATP-binding protein
MDEPFGAIDEITRTALQGELDRICRTANVTLIMVTHSIQEAVYLGDRVMVMTPGPGKVREIADTSAVSDLQSPEFGDYMASLRGLLDSSRPADAFDGGSARAVLRSAH